MFEIGVTGTRGVVTDVQFHVARELVWQFQELMGPTRVHHGACTGFDELMMTEATFVPRNILKCAHPPIKTTHMTTYDLKKYNRNIMTPDEYLARDRWIVGHGKDLVIAGPKEYEPVSRGSGTWYTITYAVKMHRLVLVVFPNGKIRNGRELVDIGSPTLPATQA